MTDSERSPTPRDVEEAVASAVITYLGTHLEQFHKPPKISRTGDLVISGWATKEDGAATLVLKLVYAHNRRLAAIPNIFMPQFMRHQRMGKGTIALIRDTLSLFGYQLFVTDLVPSFYRRLVARGATVVDEDESVLITVSMDLIGSPPAPATDA